MTARPAAGGYAAPEIEAHADAALRNVRVVLGVVSCFVVGAYRPLVEPAWWASIVGVIVAIVLTVVALNTISKRAPRRRGWDWLTQTLDIVAIVALAIVLDGPLGQQSWVLLIIPVVSAAVRHGSLASVLSWVTGCAAYVLAVVTVDIGSTDDITVFARIPGALLAVAVAVGLLARWMREGWEIQNELTLRVANREHRLAVIERTVHAIRDLPPDEALELCADQILALGFDAVTVDHLSGDRPPLAIGKRDLVAEQGPLGSLDLVNEATVTLWTQDEQVRVHSVALHEPQTRSLVTGWSEHPITEHRARAFATLIGHASMAIETTTLPRRAPSHRRPGRAHRPREPAGPRQRARATDPRDRTRRRGLHRSRRLQDDQRRPRARDRRQDARHGRPASREGHREPGHRCPVRRRRVRDPVARRRCRRGRRNRSVDAGGRVEPRRLGTHPPHAGDEHRHGHRTNPGRRGDLVRTADRALYRAKAAGKGTVVLIDADAPGPGIETGDEPLDSDESRPVRRDRPVSGRVRPPRHDRSRPQP